MLPFCPGYRSQIIEHIGSEELYKVVFSVLALLALILMGLGKGSLGYIGIWGTPDILRYIAVIFVLLSFILIVAAYFPNNIKRYVPHPMLAGIIIWGVVHILVNGDLISIILFGSFVIYSAVAIYLSNKREGEETPCHDRVPIQKDLIVTGIAGIGFLLLFWLHEELFGRSVFI